MTPQLQFFNAWQFHVDGVARKFSRVVARYGWGADDCSQHALLLLWRLALRPRLWAMPPGDLEKYLAVAVRRDVLRSARFSFSGLSVEQRTIERTAAARRDALTEFVLDVLNDAPSVDVANYLSWKLGLTPDRPEWSNNKFVRVRKAAGEFLTEQMKCGLQ
jgi:hypothetical protein